MKNNIENFLNWLKENQFKIMKRHSNYVPGEAYSAPPFQEWSMEEVKKLFEDFCKSFK